ncbi:hypothetical protein BU16DRAFT_579481 [Lophium mytilinum]|uniref:Uncharacterized protein n=1 Tax=Lophium mytilinum TaxID=390894 RepID=A0A6A6R1S9_9PEZI|nr:hypothetical protein BU16DRAFT_579481 [Lophium mytilinum]
MADQAYNNALNAYYAAYAANTGQQQQYYYPAVQTAPQAAPTPLSQRVDSAGNPMPQDNSNRQVATVTTAVNMQPAQNSQVVPQSSQSVYYMIPGSDFAPAHPPAPDPYTQLVYPKNSHRFKSFGLFDALAMSLIDERKLRRTKNRASSTPTYVTLPRSYPPPTPQYQAGYPYQQQPAPQTKLAVGPSARYEGYVYQNEASPSPSRSSSATQPPAERTHEYEYFHYREQQPPPKPVPPPAPQPPPTHVMHCHVCIKCNQPRSRKFHHHFPVIPGQPTIQGTCAKCDKKERGRPRRVIRRKSIMRRKSPEERAIRIEITSPDRERGRARGRSSSSERIVVRRTRSLSRDAPRARGHSRTRITLRTSSTSPSPVREVRTRVIHRSSSTYSSPEREVIKTKTVRESVHRALDAYRSQSPFGHRPHTRSPEIEVTHFLTRESRADAERRIASHPEAFSYGHRSPSPSPPPVLRRRDRSRVRGILRSLSRTRSPPRQQESRMSKASMMVEVGGPRVQFAPPPPSPRPRSVTESSAEFWRGRSRERLYGGDAHFSRDETPPGTRLQDYNYYQPPPSRSPVPRPTPFSPPPADPVNRLELELERTRISEDQGFYRGGPGVRYIVPIRSPTPQPPPPPPAPPAPPPTKPPWEDGTDSGTSENGTVEFVDVKEVWGRDDDGKMARFLEETRTVRVPDRKGAESVMQYRDV